MDAELRDAVLLVASVLPKEIVEGCWPMRVGAIMLDLIAEARENKE